jgi:hypothetical protein
MGIYYPYTIPRLNIYIDRHTLLTEAVQVDARFSNELATSCESLPGFLTPCAHTTTMLYPELGTGITKRLLALYIVL